MVLMEMTWPCRCRGTTIISTRRGTWEVLGCTHQAGCCNFTARNSLRANQEVVLLLADSQLEERHKCSEARKAGCISKDPMLEPASPEPTAPVSSFNELFPLQQPLREEEDSGRWSYKKNLTEVKGSCKPKIKELLIYTRKCLPGLLFGNKCAGLTLIKDHHTAMAMPRVSMSPFALCGGHKGCSAPRPEALLTVT